MRHHHEEGRGSRGHHGEHSERGSMAAGVAAVADAVSVSLATANCVW